MNRSCSCFERQRRNGRNDYPVRPLWNSLLAGFVFGHDSIASLRRELLRNAQLREVCGFDLFKGTAAVPTECAYTRFQRRLAKHEAEFLKIHHHLLDLLKEHLPDLGAVLALDGKGVARLCQAGEQVRITPCPGTSCVTAYDVEWRALA